MRKDRNGFWRGLRATVFSMVGAAALAGCASGPSPKETLGAAYKELESANPNYAQMSAAADEYIKAQPTGAAVADAYYLKGRALEERAQRDPASPQQDWVEAYNFYQQALAANPRPGLDGLIHSGMGNVLYFQDRYAAAINELSSAHEKLERDGDKAWALYRIGLCHQRQGQWDEADKFFAAVRRDYPNTIQAQRARDHQGARAFWVQVTPQTSRGAGPVADELKRQGLNAQLFVDTTRNAQVVRVGPLTSYDSAVAMKKRVVTKYPDAIIVP
jgi:tetratricopeptide (TPR) repeat protein